MTICQYMMLVCLLSPMVYHSQMFFWITFSWRLVVGCWGDPPGSLVLDLASHFPLQDSPSPVTHHHTGTQDACRWYTLLPLCQNKNRKKCKIMSNKCYLLNQNLIYLFYQFRLSCRWRLICWFKNSQYTFCWIQVVLSPILAPGLPVSFKVSISIFCVFSASSILLVFFLMFSTLSCRVSLVCSSFLFRFWRSLTSLLRAWTSSSWPLILSSNLWPQRKKILKLA